MQEFKVKHQDLGEILLLGDLNSRIGLENPVHDDEDLELEAEYLTKDKPGNHPESKYRASKDAEAGISWTFYRALGYRYSIDA